jgi:acyl-CoA thioester hydrolase
MFETTLKVRYAETDAMGVVHHAVHFVWFEAARVDFLDQAGLPYAELERRGFFLPVTDAGCRYSKPVRFGETVRVRVRIVRLTKVGMRIQYEVFRSSDGAKSAAGYTVHPVVNRESKIVRMPDDLGLIFERSMNSAD